MNRRPGPRPDRPRCTGQMSPVAVREHRRMRKLPIGCVAGAAATVLGACAVGPNYHRPVTPVPPQFANISQPGFGGAEVEAKFWTLFNDPRLDRLVDDALVANKDLQRARANLRASRAVRRLSG